jgi:hypothetical protein
LGLTFFTLPSDYKIQLHTQIWELIQFGNGFTWSDVYTMPIHLRNFYFKKLVELKKKEAEEIKQAQSKTKSSSVRRR